MSSFSSYFRRSSKVLSAPAELGPRFYGQDCCNTSTELTGIITPKQFCWAMTGAQWITEAQTFYLVSRTGKLIFMQIAFSNLSWPAQTSCQTTVWIHDPEEKGGGAREWHEHTAASKMKISHDKRSVQVKTISFEHDDSRTGGQIAKLEFEGADHVSIQIEFEALTDAFSIKDGNIHFGFNKRDGHINMKFIPFARIHGNVVRNGVAETFEGNGMCVHQFQGLKPYLSASRWNVFYFQSDREEDRSIPSVSAFMTEIRTPNLYDRATFNLGSIYVEGKLTGVSIGNKIEVDKVVVDPESHYNIPGTFIYTWEGVTFSDEPFFATCTMSTGKPCQKFNVLDHLPFFLRKAIEAFVTRPFAYYWIGRGEISMKIGDQESTVKGWVVQELSLINAE